MYIINTLCTLTLSFSSGPSLPHNEDEDDTNDDESAPGPSRGRRPPAPPPHYKKTPAQQEGERILSLLISEGAGRSFSFQEAADISSFITKDAKKQTTRFAGVLEVGSQLKIPCKIFTKVLLACCQYCCIKWVVC